MVIFWSDPPLYNFNFSPYALYFDGILMVDITHISVSRACFSIPPKEIQHLHTCVFGAFLVPNFRHSS